jgi:transcriptional regulator GlxA family with amidase domain
MDSLWLEEKCHGLMQAMVEVYHGVQAEVDRLPMVRRSARLELYRRLSNARDFIDENLDRSIALKEMADIACLSTHYFLRRFEQAFQETPHQYLIRKRISRAKELLLTTDHSITDISSKTGFPSLSAFSWLFRQRTGVSPALYRTMQGPSA